MYTEDEAKKKWCPHVRVMDFGTSAAGVRSAGVNRGTERAFGDKPFATCIGSQCMAWRWDRYGRRTFSPDSTPGAGGGSYQATDIKVGYCGLAGEPKQ